MSTQSSKQATDFYKEVVSEKKVWTIKDKSGFPSPKNLEGKRSMPFWSSLRRVEKIINSVPDYSNFTPHEITIDQFISRWLPGMKKDGLLVGLNWGGLNATGYDIEPSDVISNITNVSSMN